MVALPTHTLSSTPSTSFTSAFPVPAEQPGQRSSRHPFISPPSVHAAQGFLINELTPFEVSEPTHASFRTMGIRDISLSQVMVSRSEIDGGRSMSSSLCREPRGRNQARSRRPRWTGRLADQAFSQHQGCMQACRITRTGCGEPNSFRKCLS